MKFRLNDEKHRSDPAVIALASLLGSIVDTERQHYFKCTSADSDLICDVIMLILEKSFNREHRRYNNFLYGELFTYLKYLDDNLKEKCYLSGEEYIEVMKISAGDAAKEPSKGDKQKILRASSAFLKITSGLTADDLSEMDVDMLVILKNQLKNRVPEAFDESLTLKTEIAKDNYKPNIREMISNYYWGESFGNEIRELTDSEEDIKLVKNNAGRFSMNKLLGTNLNIKFLVDHPGIFRALVDDYYIPQYTRYADGFVSLVFKHMKKSNKDDLLELLDNYSKYCIEFIKNSSNNKFSIEDLFEYNYIPQVGYEYNLKNNDYVVFFDYLDKHAKEEKLNIPGLTKIMGMKYSLVHLSNEDYISIKRLTLDKFNTSTY